MHPDWLQVYEPKVHLGASGGILQYEILKFQNL